MDDVPTRNLQISERTTKSFHQRLTGASLLVFLNKTDMEHCMSEQEVREVGLVFVPLGFGDAVCWT
jgi:hypothetical protein